MCNKKCKKCMCTTEDPKMITIEESKYLFAKEMFQHYKELYETALSELKFKSLNVQHLLSIIEEVVVLLSQNRPHLMIGKIIDNGIERYNMDLNLHNSSIADWQYSFDDFIPSTEVDFKDEEDHQENMEDFNDVSVNEDEDECNEEDDVDKIQITIKFVDEDTED